MTFQVGQKVECIDADDQDLFIGDTPVAKGEFYHVREAYDHWQGQAMRVQEIRNPIDRAYFASRFRAVVEAKTDISIFTEMLTKTEVDA
jgi:hypothetical protein